MSKWCKQDKIRVGEVLLHKGLITQTQLSEVLAIQKISHQKLGKILVQQGLVSSSQLHQALREQAWRNVAATCILAVSTLLPNLPRVLAQAQQSEVPRHRHNNHSPIAHRQDIGGVEPQDATGGSSAPSAQSPSRPILQSPLAKKASVASPLRGFCHPLNGQGWLSQGIRGRTHRGRMEFAYDLATSIGTPVYTMRAGKVIAVQDKYPDTGGGKENIARFNYVWVEHDEGYRTVYVHLQQGFRRKVSIKAGDRVEAGQLIGYSGNSGWSTGPHLHVEVQKPSKRQTFTKTVPFEIAGACHREQLAQNLK